IRMKNRDIIELFDQLPTGTEVFIAATFTALEKS
ncbi:MAG: L,D-transpeptidase, partial [Gammaproteobacteria bacterium]